MSWPELRRWLFRDNPINQFNQAHPWLRGGLHHAAEIALPSMLVSDLWWGHPWPWLVAGFWISWYAAEPAGRIAKGEECGFEEQISRDVVTDWLWPAGTVALYLWAGPWVTVPALLGAGLVRWGIWGLRHG